MEQSLYKLTFSRECIVPTLEVWDHGEGDYLAKETGFPVPPRGYQFFVYHDGFVRNYVHMRTARAIRDFVQRMASKDSGYFGRRERAFWQQTKIVKPYFTGRKTIESKPELKKFYLAGCFWWANYTLAYWLSYFSDHKVSKEVFYRAEKIRLSNNNMVLSFNNAFKRGLRVLLAKSFTDDYLYLTVEEILRSELSEEWLKRKRHAIYFNNAFNYGSLSSFIREHGIKLEKVRRYKNKLRGLVAFPGKVTGTVKICLIDRALPKVKRGDILVSSMTMPNFLPALQRAAAIITDEGGITCHAAIIARELKKPCLIGTNVATEVLKDGDIVQVIADQGSRGIVKVIQLA